MKSKSFFEVLEDQIRKEVRDEMARNGLRSSEDRLEQRSSNTPLAAQPSGPLPIHEFSFAELYSTISKTSLATKSIPAEYRRANAKPIRETFGSSASSANVSCNGSASYIAGAETSADATTATSQETFVCRTAEQWIAFHLLNKNGVEIKSEFTRAELKSAARKIALRFHPDRNIGLSADKQIQATEKFLQLRSSLEQLLDRASISNRSTSEN